MATTQPMKSHGLFCETRGDSLWLQGWWTNKGGTHNWAHCHSLHFSLTLESELVSFPWIQLTSYSVWNPAGFLQDLLKHFVFLVNVLFCMGLLLGHFGLILRSDYFNWSWLKMAFGSFLSGPGCFRWNFWFFKFCPIPLGAVLWRLAKKAKPSV